MDKDAWASKQDRRVRINPFIWVIPLILSGIGILMITSTTSPTSFLYTGTPFQMGMKQLRWLVLAMCGMLFVYSIPLRLWYKASSGLVLSTWLMSWLPLIPGIGESIG